MGRSDSRLRAQYPIFLYFFWNPECVRIFCVYALKIFSIEHFCVQSDLRKSSVFHGFPCPYHKKKYRARVPKILMPPTFPIVSLNGYTPNFSGGGLKVDLESSVWPLAPSKVSLSEKLSIIFGVFWGRFWTKLSFPAKRSTLVHSTSYIFSKLQI